MKLDFCDTPQNYEPVFIKHDIRNRDFPENTEIEYECGVGHSMRNYNDRFIKCVKNTNTGLLEWTDMKLDCVPIQCPYLENPPNGQLKTITGTYPSYGSEVGFECNEGFYRYSSSGFLTRVCREDGEWNNSLFDCLPVACAEIPKVENGNCRVTRFNDSVTTLKVVDKYTYRDRIDITCHDGYELEGHSIVTCNKEGIWSPEFPKCVVKKSARSCPNPYTSAFKTDYPFVNSTVKVGVRENHEVLFWCDDSDDKILSKCTLKNGSLEWIPSPPKCITKKTSPTPTASAELATTLTSSRPVTTLPPSNENNDDNTTEEEVTPKEISSAPTPAPPPPTPRSAPTPDVKPTTTPVISNPITSSPSSNKNNGNNTTVVLASGVLVLFLISVISYFIYNNKKRDNLQIIQKRP